MQLVWNDTVVLFAQHAIKSSLCAVSNVTVFAPFSDVTYPFVFNSFEKRPRNHRLNSEGRCCAWGKSLLEVSSPSALNSSAISHPTEKANHTLLSSAATNLKLSLSDVDTSRREDQGL